MSLKSRLPIRGWSLTIICICLAIHSKAFAYEIKGILHLDNSWRREIYLSAIRSFDDINTVSEDFIINAAPIGEDGSFVLTGNNLPEGDGLYRLHVCKLDDPAATLIIGGKEENYIHFVMNNQSRLVFTNDQPLFSNCEINGDQANVLLRTLNNNIEYWQNKPIINTVTNWEYNQKQLDQCLHHFADTCSNGLVTLLALHYINIQKDYSTHHGFYKNQLQKWKSGYSTSPYYQELAGQIEFIRYKDAPRMPSIILGALLFVSFISIGFYLLRKNAKSSNLAESDAPKMLSVQEQKVFGLLTEGKANKEISSELNIEVSTVKSHVSSIYNKLGIKSRKEIYKRKEGDR